MKSVEARICPAGHVHLIFGGDCIGEVKFKDVETFSEVISMIYASLMVISVDVPSTEIPGIILRAFEEDEKWKEN